MEQEIILTKEVREQIIKISYRLTNLKYSLKFFFQTIENEGTSCSLCSLSLILEEYFNITKKMYNDMEKFFGTYE